MTEQERWTIRICEDHRVQDCALCGVFDVITVVKEADLSTYQRELKQTWEARQAAESRVQELEGERDEAVARLERTDEYAREGWAWLDDALAALGAENVFQIKEAKAARESHLARLEEALARIANFAEADYSLPSKAIDHCRDLARSALTHSTPPSE